MTDTAKTATREILLKATDIVAGYVPGVNILNGCNLEVAKGELVGIIGPNGAGKSTLLKALFGLVHVRSGTVTMGGEDITNHKANSLVSQGVGFVPQNNNVFPSLTVEENMRMGVYLRPKSFTERFEFIADLFPTLGERRAQRAGAMSGGERQMVAMARALMMNPSVLLLDEPSAGLSPVRQDETFLRTRMINKAGRVGRDGGAERAALPADLRPRVRARPGQGRVHRDGQGAAVRPEGDLAVPGDLGGGRRQGFLICSCSCPPDGREMCGRPRSRAPGGAPLRLYGRPHISRPSGSSACSPLSRGGWADGNCLGEVTVLTVEPVTVRGS